MAELQNGPVICGVCCSDAFDDFVGDTTFIDNTGCVEIDHDISVVGYGIDNNGQEFWKVRNSWGEAYGYDGYVNVLKGKGNIGIETQCVIADPVVDKYTAPEPFVSVSVNKKSLFGTKTQKNMSTFFNYFSTAVRQHFYESTYNGGFRSNLPNPEFVITTPLPQDTVSDEELPETLDYRTALGVNVLSWTVNQHRPVWCGSCYA